MTSNNLRGGAGRTWMRSVLSALLAIFVVLSLPGSASAQDAEEDGPIGSIGGTLQTNDEDGERIPVEGVTFIVYDAEGTEVASAVTDAEGAWIVELNESGIFDVELAVETLPEGVDLRDADRNPLTGIEVRPGDEKNTLFALGDRQVSDDNTIVAIQLLADGIKFGLIIAMCAIGLSLIYGTTGLTNFAHGESVTIGAVVAYIFHMVYGAAGKDMEFFGLFNLWSNGRLFGIPGTNSLVFSAITAVIISGLLGWVFNEYVWKRLRNKGASLISALVVSIGLSIFFRYVILFQLGGRTNFYRDAEGQERIDLGWFALEPKDIIIVVLSIVVLVVVGLLLQKTRAGKAMRAVADNRDLAESSGIDVEAVIKWVWITGSGLAGLGGVLFGISDTVNWEMGFRLLLLMFAGVTLGGLGTAYGALFGSLIVGIFIQLITLPDWFPSDMRNVGALAVLVLILLVRPQGLLGRSERIG